MPKFYQGTQALHTLLALVRVSQVVAAIKRDSEVVV
jgi:hypothetical protein